MNKKKLALVVILFATLFFTLGEQSVYADVILNVSVDTSALSLIPGESEIVFVLTDGSGGVMADANNTATLGSFAFGIGGSAGAVDISITGSTGGWSGSLSGASLTDSEFLNVFAAKFTAGNQLSFVLDLTTNVDAGLTAVPDQFAFAIVDPNGVPISTMDPTLSNNLLVINLDSANPTVLSYSDKLTTTPVPEPSSLLLVGTALLALGASSRRKAAAG